MVTIGMTSPAKRIVLILLLVCGMLRTTAVAQSQWEPCNSGTVSFAATACTVALPNGRVVVGGSGVYDTYHIGIFVSTDSGATWRQSLRGVPVHAMARETGSGLLIAVADSDVYRSTDNGDSWSLTTLPHLPGGIRAITIGSDQTVYVSNSSTSQVFRSGKFGDSWVEITSVLEQAPAISLLAAPSGLYAATTHGLYRSTNRGSTWTKLTSVGDRTFGYLSKAPNGTLYAASFSNSATGVYHSSDNGETWIHTDVGNTANRLHAACVDSSNAVYVWSYLGMFRSSDNGQTWDTIQTRLLNSGIEFNPSVYTFESDGASLYFGVSVGYNQSAVIRSYDQGRTWSRPPGASIGESIIHDLSVDPDQGLVAVTNHGLYRTHDKGDSWERLGEGVLSQVRHYVRTNAGVLFAAEDTLGLYRSLDNGHSWEPSDTTQQAYGVFVYGLAATEDGSVYMVRSVYHWPSTHLDLTLYRSRTGGVSWDSVSSLTNFFYPFGRFRNITAYHNTLYMAVDGKGYPGHPYYVNDTFAIYRSTDGGAHWTNSGEITRGEAALVSVNPYAGDVMAGIFWSTNGGDTWYRRAKWSIMSDPMLLASPLYAFSANWPPYRSNDNGETWDSIPRSGVIGVSLGCGALDSSGTLFGGSSSGYGVFRTAVRTLAVGVPRSRSQESRSNPAVSDYLIVPGDSDVPIRIYDLLGRPQACPILRNERETVLDIRALPDGVYLMQGSGITLFAKRTP